MSGSITASGDISALGNVMAGGGGTGSFDHIITSQNTIEFRNPASRAPVGFVSFDATNGLSPMDATRKSLPRLADKFATARTIDGVSFDGTANITTNQHMGSTSHQLVKIGDFNWQQNRFLNYSNAMNKVSKKWEQALTNLHEKDAQEVYAHVQIPIGRKLLSIVPYGTTAPLNSAIKNKIDIMSFNIAGVSDSDAIQWASKKTGKVLLTGAELTTLGIVYLVSNSGGLGLGGSHTSAADNYMVIKLTLLPESSFKGLILNYS